MLKYWGIDRPLRAGEQVQEAVQLHHHGPRAQPCRGGDLTSLPCHVM